ncbi:MAG: response regulator transcription factor [Chloroflexi bacterium]|nr:response regulator transcription factor [Chloroflexota bacterium]
MKTDKVNVSIMEDHQGIIDGYLYRLNNDKTLNIAGIARYGADLEPMLASTPTDIIILDMEVQISATDTSIFPILQTIPKLIKKYPKMTILVISMFSQIVLIERLVELGISGYIFKNDSEAIQNLAQVISTLSQGGTYFSQGIIPKLRSLNKQSSSSLLSPRQLEALSLCVAYPDNTTDDLAIRLGVSSSTFRNTLSSAYERLGVHTRRAAIAYFQKLGINEPNFNRGSAG